MLERDGSVDKDKDCQRWDGSEDKNEDYRRGTNHKTRTRIVGEGRIRRQERGLSERDGSADKDEDFRRGTDQ